MDAKSVGMYIAELRKKKGLTQVDLARKLHVSDKTVSKWESGQGFPEITQFPVLSELFGVSIDRLMTGKKKGMIIAGNMLVDLVKTLDVYPQCGMLAGIKSVSRAVGGCVPNVAIDLAKIDKTLPLAVLGKVGDDEYGRYLISRLQHQGIDVSGVKISSTSPTSFSDVMSLPTGERTFFHARGSNAEFSPDDINISSLNCSILHIGYIMLLDSFDRDDEKYGTVMARFLHDVQQLGISTSIDVVSSEDLSEYEKRILPALKYADYAIMNEIESCTTFGISPRQKNGKLDLDAIRTASVKMAEAGVQKRVIIHAKEAGFCYNCETGEFSGVASLNIPPSMKKGSVGAGDAFCAGCLYGFYNGFDDKEILDFASSAAGCNLFSENSVDGMKEKSEIYKVEKHFGRPELSEVL